MTDAATAKLERLLGMSGRLAGALKEDLGALERGRPREFKLIDPELQRLAGLYEREAAALSAREMEAAPVELRESYLHSVRELRELLKRQQRLLTRMRHIGEGMVRAVAEELTRRETSARPYSAGPARTAQAPGAMLYNRTA